MEVWCGLGGGCAAEAMKWFRIREELHEGLPDYAKNWGYWLVTGIMILVGGLLVLVYQSSGDVQLSPILAFNIGVSAPLIISALAGQVPPIDRGAVD